MNIVIKALKMAYIAITYKDEFRHQYDMIRALKGQIEARKDEIIELYETMQADYHK